MNKFGVLKNKILNKLASAYATGDKAEIKKILHTIKENKDFKELYLFYEEIENKYINDRENAKLYVDDISSLLQESTQRIINFCDELNKKLGETIIESNEIYSCLDMLSEKDDLKNIDKKIYAKTKLVEHLTKEKKTDEEDLPVIQNESLLHTVLSNNFNALYGNTLTEEEKKELQNILLIPSKDLNDKFTTLKEEISIKVKSLTESEKNTEMLDKLSQVINEMLEMDVSKYNYYRLLQLKNGL